MKKTILALAVLSTAMQSCFVQESTETTSNTDTLKKEVNVYSHRHYDVDKELFADFEKETGIKVNVIEDDADKLMVRLKNEGENSPADLLITADAGRLIKAQSENLLQSFSNETINNRIPVHLRDEKGFWYGLTQRARVIVVHRERGEKLAPVLRYEDLADPKLKGKVLIRSSENVYNQSLMAALIAELGRDKALEWAKGVVANMAREPKGGDKDQVLAIAAGEGDVAVVNTYYIGKMLSSENPEEVKAAEMIRIVFPNQDDRGTHINISGAGLAKHAPNKENAIRLLEFLLSDKAQEKFAQANNEYPVVNGIAENDLLKSWGEFKRDSLPLSNLGEYNEEALKVFNEAGWK